MATPHRQKRRLKRWLYFPIALAAALLASLLYMLLAKGGLRLVKEELASTAPVQATPEVTEPVKVPKRLFRYRVNGKWGYIDQDKNRWGFPLQTEGKSRYGYVAGDTGVQDFPFDMVTDFSEGLALVGIKNGAAMRFSVVDMAGEVLASDLPYEEVRAFSGGFAAVRDSNGWGMINEKGQVAVAPQYDLIGDVTTNNPRVEGETSAAANLPNAVETASVDENRSGDVYATEGAVPSDSSDPSATDTNATGDVATTDGVGAESGAEAANLAAQETDMATTMINEVGLAVVMKNNKFGYVEPAQGAEAMLKIAMLYDSAQDFSEGYAFVGTKNADASMAYGVIYVDGRGLLTLGTKQGKIFSEGRAALQQSGSEYVYLASNGDLPPVNTFLNDSGEPQVFEGAKNFSDGLAAVKLNGLWGYIRAESGEMAIPAKYQNAMSFSEGIAFVQDETGKWGAIRLTGEKAVEFEYDSVIAEKDDTVMKDGYGLARKGNAVYCISADNGEAIQLYTEELSDAVDEQEAKRMTVRISSGNLNVRSSASTTASVVTTVSDGTELTVIGSQDDWSQVKLDNSVEGWIKSSYLQG